MGSLTVREKEHWKERIVRKIDQVTEALLAKSNPTYRDQIESKAKEMAIESLGLAQLCKRWGELVAQEKLMQQQRNKIGAEMLAIACGISPDGNRYEGRYYSDTSIPYQVTGAVQRRQLVHQQELMAEDELGQKLLELEREKEELLDTVWLATSSKQIKMLWQKMSELFSLTPTAFQQEALDIDPVEGE